MIIIETMVPDWPLLDLRARDAAHARIANDVVTAISLAPLHVKIGVSVLSILLGAMVRCLALTAGGSLGRRNERANRLYGLIQRLPGPMAAVVRLYRSMTLLSYYEQPEIAQALLALGETRA
ncbi:hypothetical protein GGD83_004595 [Rhodoblastus sphagnicola]|uniref:hypothetical protein n=1 Tax=Rhodoblastus sphagnicola TaxID=333368 RepID=UPI0011B0C2A8|nr:hypothetical protein [Rhodoblastus sphagnicola]MBB4200766.1 hypothetical protein [Rhodoblastus sphagnicola]